MNAVSRQASSQAHVSGPVRIGVIGARNIGIAHMRRCRELSPHRALLVAAADTDPRRLEQVRAEFDQIKCCAGGEELLAEEDIHGVILALPNHLHAPLTIAALRAGKHVLCEKPIANSSAEARKMIAARDAAGKVLMIGMNQRFTPLAYGIRSLIREGVLGEVHYARTRWFRQRSVKNFQPGNRGAWASDKGLSGGGPLMDIGSHKLDLAWYFMGRPRAESADGVCFTGIGREEAAAYGIDYRLEDHAVGFIRCEGNRLIQVEASNFQNVRGEGQDLVLYGRKGAVEMLSKQPPSVYTVETGGVREVGIPTMPEAPNSAVQHFVNVLQGREALSSTAEDGLAVLLMMEAIYRSAETGELVKLG
jgi:predicted dehydrogenase